MGGQSNGYQSQPMQSWGYGGSGSGGGYGMGNYRQPMYGQQSNQYYGGNQYGNPYGQFMPQFNRQFQGGYAGGNMSQVNSAGIGQDAPYQPPSMYQNPMNLGAMTGGNMGAGNVAGPGLGGGGQQIVRQPPAPTDGNMFDTPGYVPPFNPYIGGGYNNNFSNRMPMYGQNQYGNPFGQFMQQWPQFGQQYMGGQQLYGNPGGMGIPQGPQSIGGMGVMGGNMINPSGVGDPSQNYRQQIRLQAGPQYETTGIVPPGGMTQNNGQLDYAEQQQPFGGGF